MNSSKIVSIGNFDLRLHHLLIIGILSLSFSISFLLRVQPADFGYELNEFDPFFNYRATQYIVENGISDYFEWHDDLSWYPNGRNVSLNSQVILHLTAASTYWIFGGDSSLYDFTIMFPVIFGSLTGIVIFALVRTIGGTTAGLFASLLYAISIPILIRGPLGWFKSEPLGVFFSVLAVYLLLSGLNSRNKKIVISKLIGAGIITVFGVSAWGGNQFFMIPIGIFFLALPFLRKDKNFLLWAVPLYTLTTILVAFSFERVSVNFVYGLSGLSIIFPTILMVACIFIQKKSSKYKNRNSAIFLIVLLALGFVFLLSDLGINVLQFSTHRYMNAINPFLTTTDPLVDSVSEHATTTIEQSFYFHSILMLFSGIAIWILLKNVQSKSKFIKNDMLSFALIIGFIGVYTSSTFVRLELFASISIIILASLGLSVLMKELFSKPSNTKKKSLPIFIKIPFAAGVIILLIVPMVYPVGGEIPSVIKGPPTILNGGTAYTAMATNDWLDTLSWIKSNTSEDAVIASWWDYGYWISTMSERATLADNSTLNTKTIKNIAKLLLSHPDDAWNMLNDMGATHIVTFVASNQLNLNSERQFFTLAGGGDESKKQWFMRIGGFDERQFLHSDGMSGTDKFWNETLLGKMFPYSILGYVNPNNLNQQSNTFVPGMVGIYEKSIKFPEDENGPVKLVYASPSYHQNQSGPKLVVLVYEINQDYIPN